MGKRIIEMLEDEIANDVAHVIDADDDRKFDHHDDWSWSDH